MDKVDTIGALYGITEPRVQQNKLQRHLGEFTPADNEVIFGVEIEWEMGSDEDDRGEVISQARDSQFGLTHGLIERHYPDHKVKSSDQLARVRQITSQLIQYHEEPSLVNGIELVLGPANSKLMRMIIESVMASARGQYVASERCSTHVHMNVCDFTIEHLGVLTLLYPFIEELLFKWTDPERWHNPFTRPWCTDATVTFEPRKYQALNLVPSGCSIEGPFGAPVLSPVGRLTLGTVEFRHFPGLHDGNAAAFAQWLDFIEEFRSVCFRHTREDLIALFQPLISTSGYVEVLRQLFPLAASRWLSRFHYNELQSFMSGPVAAFRRTLGQDSASSAYREEFGIRQLADSPLYAELMKLPAKSKSPLSFVEALQLQTGANFVAEAAVPLDIRSVGIDEVDMNSLSRFSGPTTEELNRAIEAIRARPMPNLPPEVEVRDNPTRRVPPTPVVRTGRQTTRRR